MTSSRLTFLLSVISCLLCVSWAHTSTISSAEQKCIAVKNLAIKNTSIKTSEYLPAGMTLKVAHCRVVGETNHHTGKDGKEYGDRFEIRMPDGWNSRSLFQGGGGLDGVLSPAVGQLGLTKNGVSQTALERGYAVMSTDGGHQSSGPRPDGSFGSDPEALADYNYRSTKLVMDVAREVISHYYGHPPKRSYFKGCSNGGREGLMAVQRYPEYFDGVIAGAPAFNLTNAAIAEAWATVQFASIAPKDAKGQRNLSAAMSDKDMKLIAESVLLACDELDGVKDGLIFNPAACHFDPSTIQCKSDKNDSCLSADQVRAIKKIFNGPTDSKGRAIYSDWPYDTGVADIGWRMWTLGIGSVPPINVVIFPEFFNGVALASEKPAIDIFTFDFDKDPGRVNKAAAEINATATDLSKFSKHKGKLLLYTGMSDPVFSANDLVRYYKDVASANGGMSNAVQFARLFLVPGMTHCGGGPALDNFDSLAALQDWVENGIAPDSMVATGRTFPGRTRPLCAYPLIPKYKGTGSTEDAANFVCQSPTIATDK